MARRFGRRGRADCACALDFLRAFVRLAQIVMVFISVLTLKNLEKIGLFVNLKEILRNLKKSVDGA